jgi:hypothetical protein
VAALVKEQQEKHEFQHFGAMVEDDRHLAVKVTVQQVDHDPWRQTIRQGGKSAHVRQPDRRMDFLDIAAPDMPGEDPGRKDSTRSSSTSGETAPSRSCGTGNGRSAALSDQCEK